MLRPALLMLLVIFVSEAQARDTVFYKHNISVETGIFSRGLFGLTYTWNFADSPLKHLALETYGGVGYTLFSGLNVFGGFNPVINLGRNYFFVMFGIDIKYYRVTGESGYVKYRDGISIVPLVGIQLQSRIGLSFKARLSVIDGDMLSFTGLKFYPEFPSVGISFGYSF